MVNAASDLMVEAFSDAGRHARFAVGTNALPLNCLVEIDGVLGNFLGVGNHDRFNMLNDCKSYFHCICQLACPDTNAW